MAIIELKNSTELDITERYTTGKRVFTCNYDEINNKVNDFIYTELELEAIFANTAHPTPSKSVCVNNLTILFSPFYCLIFLYNRTCICSNVQCACADPL
jgi:hypothetical protein